MWRGWGEVGNSSYRVMGRGIEGWTSEEEGGRV